MAVPGTVLMWCMAVTGHAWCNLKLHACTRKHFWSPPSSALVKVTYLEVACLSDAWRTPGLLPCAPSCSRCHTCAVSMLALESGCKPACPCIQLTLSRAELQRQLMPAASAHSGGHTASAVPPGPADQMTIGLRKIKLACSCEAAFVMCSPVAPS